MIDIPFLTGRAVPELNFLFSTPPSCYCTHPLGASLLYQSKPFTANMSDQDGEARANFCPPHPPVSAAFPKAVKSRYHRPLLPSSTQNTLDPQGMPSDRLEETYLDFRDDSDKYGGVWYFDPRRGRVGAARY
jgi:hypothetical protein